MEAGRQVHFRDARPPQEIQFALEREIMSLLTPAMEGARLQFRAAFKVNGAPHRMLLNYAAALPGVHCYSLRLEVVLSEVPEANRDYHRKALDGWFDLWTREFSPGVPPGPGEGSEELYRSTVTAAMSSESHLTDVPAVQREILARMRGGAMYTTAHKEGGTNIQFLGGRFVRADYGESSTREAFRDEAAFLTFLRKFYDWETSRNTYPEKVPEYDAWKLMLRLLRPPSGGGMGVGGGNSRAPVVSPASMRRLPFSMGWILLAIATFIGLSQLLTMRTIGAPHGPSVRVGNTVATLIRTQERYIPSLHRNPEKDRFRYDLHLLPLGGAGRGRMVPIARGLSYASPANGPSLLGSDGRHVWFLAGEIGAYDVMAGKRVTAKEMVHRNPVLIDLLPQGFFEVDGRLRISTRDDRTTVEVDPETLVAQSVPPVRRSGWPLSRSGLEQFLCAGGRFPGGDWYGVHTSLEVEQSFRPGSSLPKEAPVGSTIARRKVYQGRLEATDGRTRIVSMTALSGVEYLGGAVVSVTGGKEPMRLTNPDGVLILSWTDPGLTGTLKLTRVDTTGREVWTTELGLRAAEQILPGEETLVVVGTRPATPGKLPEPVIVSIESRTGLVSAYSLRMGS